MYSKRLRIPLFALSVFLLAGCSQPAEQKTDAVIHADTTISWPDQELEGSALSTTRNEFYEVDTTTEIFFDELTVFIHGMLVYDEFDALEEIQQDEEVFLDIDLGETIEQKLIEIKTDKLSDITVEQAYETSITVSNEGPHCDLYDWEHYVSDWEVLSKDADGNFKTLGYTEEETNLFPEVSIMDLEDAVYEQCGATYRDLVAEAGAVNVSPVYVTISRYFLRITGVSLSTGDTITKTITITVPMGC